VRSFVQNLFRPAAGQDLLELWFPVCIPTLVGVVHQKAVHFGGIRSNGCKNKQPLLALYFDAEKLNALVAEKPSQAWAEPINSFVSICILVSRGNLAETYVLPELKIRYPRCNFGRHRDIHSGALIDQATLVRIRAPDLAYIPKNLAKDVYFLC